MVDARKRSRTVVAKTSGRLSNAISRRRAKADGKIQDTPDDKIVEYFGNRDDTPLIELMRTAPTKVRPPRNNDNIHVSDLIHRCVRRILLMERMGVNPPAERLSEGQSVTFAIGEALHAYVVDKFTHGHPDKVYARWSCACGGTSKKGLLSKVGKMVCEDCGTHLTKHNEVSFVHPDYPLTGSPDLILRLDEYGAYYLVELKSISGNQYKELVRPVPDHIIQIVFYWQILKARGWRLVDKVSILYINKEFSFKMPYKEFLIDPQEPGLLDPYMEDLEAVKIARAGGELPPRTFCANIDSPDAKKCPVSVACFGSDR